METCIQKTPQNSRLGSVITWFCNNATRNTNLRLYHGIILSIFCKGPEITPGRSSASMRRLMVHGIRAIHPNTYRSPETPQYSVIHFIQWSQCAFYEISQWMRGPEKSSYLSPGPRPVTRMVCDFLAVIASIVGRYVACPWHNTQSRYAWRLSIIRW
ncbi:hypothetical protein J6590_104989 [Homalodisca vitripennis]|nr:hypothetical protein J6590_073115 [Homalodisca vitripennis]KAG8323892.1 hypothetical protein J6590_104989 [Homalodisca vitripennis]